MITKCIIGYVLEYKNRDGKYHNPHRPSKSSTIGPGYVYCQNGRMQNIVGKVNQIGDYYINDKRIR